MPRIIIIGIDGMEFNLIDAFEQCGQLPNKNFLRSTIPPFSPVAWNAIYTGRLDHGYEGFMKHEWGSATPRLVTSKDRNCPTIWDFVPEGTYFNIPFAEGVEGIDAHRFTDYKESMLGDFEACEKYFCEKGIEAQTKFRKGFDKLYMCVFRITDVVQHFFWDRPEKIKKIYMYLHNFIQYILAKKEPDDIVMIVSDHGFCKMKGRLHIVNYLIEKGYMILKNKPRSRLEYFKRYKWLVAMAKRFKWYGILKHTQRFSYLSQVDWDKTTVAYKEGSEGILMTKDEEYVVEIEEGYEVDGYQPDEPMVSMPKTGANGAHRVNGVFMCSHPYKCERVQDVLPLVLDILGIIHTKKEEEEIKKAYEKLGYM